MVDFRGIRETLRLARNRALVDREGLAHVGMTLDEAAAASGVNRATIHSVENVKREPDLQPQLLTIEALARAYGLTLLSFFTLVDGLRKEGLKPLRRSAHNPAVSLSNEAADGPSLLPAEPAAVVLDRLVSALHHLSADLVTIAAHARQTFDRSLPGLAPDAAAHRDDTDRVG